VSAFDRRWAPAALFAALVLVAFADPLVTRRTFIGRDIVPYDLPLEKVVHDAWSRGRVPVWWSEISGGRPLMPNPNAGVFYPARPLLSLVPLPLAMRIYPVVHWVLAGWGMLLLLGTLKTSRAAAWVGATCFVFSGVMMSEVFYMPFHPGAAALPWALWAFARPVRRGIGRVLPVAIVFGLMLLAGDVFSVAVALLSALLWLVFEAPAGERAAPAGQLALGVVAAALLALPQIAATALLAPETRRIVGGVSLGEALGFTISPWRLAELVIPYPFGPVWSMDLSLDWGTHAFRHFFTTFFVAPIALLGLFGGRRNLPRGARFARAMVLVGAGLALVGHVVPASWNTMASPIPLRYPEKFMLGATFGLAIAAGLAFDRLRHEDARRRARMLAFVVVLAAAALAARLAPAAAGRAAVRAVGAPPELAAAAAADLAPALAEAGIYWVATLVAGALLVRRDRAALMGALALLTAVPIAANRRIAQTANEGEIFPPTAFARAIARRDPAGRYRALDESYYVFEGPSALRDRFLLSDIGGTEFFRQSWIYYTPSLWKRGLVFNSDLDAGDLSRIESLRRLSAVAAAQSDSGPFFASLGLRYGIRFRDQRPVPGFEPFGGDNLRSWDENPTALPDIRLARRWTEAAGPVEALRILPRLAADGVVVETGRRAQGAAREGTVHLLEESPERLVLETACPDATWLFVLRGDWSYRTVRVDGQRADTFPAQIAFAAVAIPAGEHRVEWREDIPGIEVSRWGPAVAALLLGGIGLRKAAAAA
jgi:hypothetical protein